MFFPIRNKQYFAVARATYKNNPSSTFQSRFLIAVLNISLFHEFQGVPAFKRRDYLAFGNSNRIIFFLYNTLHVQTYSY